MNFVSAKCPSCGADFQIDSTREFGFCTYCGSKIIIHDPSTTKVKVDGPVEITGSIKTQNHEFESKLANANNWSRIYFDRGPNAVTYGSLTGYDAVIKYYSDAELVGANESKYYIDLSRFYVRANLEGFRSGNRYLKDKTLFINHYIFLMDTAINFADEDKKPEIVQEKEANLKKLNEELSKFPEKKSGCYIATAVYGSYDCPQVWTLRRFRDYTLAETWYGRVFVYLYYTISPVLVKWFGKKQWFKNLWKANLDILVRRLNNQGFENTPYHDKQW